jgi:tetratricopeptide (TPR) repeat protein
LFCRIDAYDELGQAEFTLGNFAAAEKALGEASKLNALNTDFGSRRLQRRILVWRSMALAILGRPADAAGLLAPVLAEARERNARNFDDQAERLDFAATLSAQALVDPAHRTALLDEALRLIEKLPQEMRGLLSTQQWRERILHERSGR